MKLYSYWRSSAAYRVRIALNIKGLESDYHPINLLDGEHKDPAYLARNPAGLVPALELDDGRCLAQSIAIIRWLDTEHPEPPLLPADSYERAQVEAMAYTVACEIHPLNNIAILNYLRKEFGAGQEELNHWMHTWLDRGFTTLEAEIAAGPYCAGSDITLADVLLVPMVYNALRFDYPLAEKQPRVYDVWQACNELEPFVAARPEAQPDAV